MKIRKILSFKSANVLLKDGQRASTKFTNLLGRESFHNGKTCLHQLQKKLCSGNCKYGKIA